MDTPLSSPQSLAGLVDYQPESVVSRVVLRNEGGTLTVFAFAAGQGLSEHSNPNDATILVLEGRVHASVGSHEHTLVEGDSLYLPPSVPHALFPGEPFKMLLTLLKKPRRD